MSRPGRYGNGNIRLAPISPELVARLLALVPSPASPVNLHLVGSAIGQVMLRPAAPMPLPAEVVSITTRRARVANSPNWSPEEDDRLREAYAKGERIDLLEEELGRTPRAISSRAQKLGLSGTHPTHGGWCTDPPWTEDDDRRLRQGYGKISTPALAEQLGRSKGGVFNRAFSLGLKHGYYRPFSGREKMALRIGHERGLALADIAAAMDRKAFSLSKYATRYGYSFGRRPRLASPITIDGILALQDSALPVPPTAAAIAKIEKAKVHRLAAISAAATKCERVCVVTEPPAPKPARIKSTITPGASGTARKASSAASSGAASRSIARAPFQEESARPAPPERENGYDTRSPAHPVLSPTTEPAARRPLIGWVERYQAEVAAARGFLEQHGFSVTRLAGEHSPIARWHVSGYRGEFTNDHVIALAKRQGLGA